MKYDKTQAVEYVNEFIDTPGEYMQVWIIWYRIIMIAGGINASGIIMTNDGFLFVQFF